MFTMTNARRTSRALLALTLALGAAACDNGSTEPDDHDEAAGLVVLDENDAVLVSVNAARQVTGSLTVQAGEAEHVEVWFVAEDGDRFQPDGGEHTLGWEVANEAVAVIDSHGDHMDLDGVSAGTTSVVFSIMHGNHSDYDSPAIPVTVTP